jgi:hypothetical protein
MSSSSSPPDASSLVVWGSGSGPVVPESECDESWDVAVVAPTAVVAPPESAGVPLVELSSSPPSGSTTTGPQPAARAPAIESNNRRRTTSMSMVFNVSVRRCRRQRRNDHSRRRPRESECRATLDLVMPPNDLLGAVLELPVDERARIPHELLLSLDDEQGEAAVDEREWLAKLERRRQAESGEVEMLDRAGFHEAVARRRAARRSP